MYIESWEHPHFSYTYELVILIDLYKDKSTIKSLRVFSEYFQISKELLASPARSGISR